MTARGEKEAKHTAGPWSWWTSNSVMRLTGADGKDGGVLHAYTHSGLPDISVREDDARLIAAAPDLLEALQDAEYVLAVQDASGRLSMAGSETLMKVRAALAKATGAAQ